MQTLAFVVLMLFCSCGYLKNRANDALDVFRIDVGTGPGLLLEARATDFAAVGVGFHKQTRVGVHGRFTGELKTVTVGAGPFVLGAVEHGDYEPLLPGSEFDAAHDLIPVQLFVVPSTGFQTLAPYRVGRRGLHFADLGAGLTVGYVGIGVGCSPGELVDLLLGVVGIDLAGDDVFVGESHVQAEARETTTVGR